MKRVVLLKKLLAVVAIGVAAASPGVAQTGPLAMARRAPRGPAADSGDGAAQGRVTPAGARPGPNAQKRFAADQVHFQPQIIERMVELGVGLAEIHLLWGVIEPKAPVNGVHAYRGVDQLNPQQRQFMKDFAQTDLELSMVIEAVGNEWAFERSDTISVKSPVKGNQVPGFVRLKPEHRQDWKAFVTHLLSAMPNVRYIQVENEPENVWVSGAGYVEALRLAYEAVQAFNARQGTAIQVMAAGFALGPDVITVPETILRHIHGNHPDIDIDWIRQQIKLPESIPSRQVFHTSQKFHVILSVLLEPDPPFDILTIHNDWARSYEEAARVISWYQAAMQRGGTQRPLWIDDMHAAYYPKVRPRGTPEDIRIYEALEKGSAAALRRYMEAQSAWFVKKSVWNFAAGAERLKIAPLVDMPYYFMPEWRYAGLFTEDFVAKPAYYTAQLLLQKIDYFKTVTQLRGDIYRFTFDHKDDVYIAWGGQDGAVIDASRQLGQGEVRITHLITQVDRRGNPIIRPAVQVPTTRVPVSEEPVFIEMVR